MATRSKKQPTSRKQTTHLREVIDFTGPHIQIHISFMQWEEDIEEDEDDFEEDDEDDDEYVDYEEVRETRSLPAGKKKPLLLSAPKPSKGTKKSKSRK